MKTTLAILALTLLAPALAADLATDLDNAARVQAGDHANWVKARDRVVAHGPDAVAELSKAASAENWTADSWVKALAAEVIRLRISKPELAAKVDSPQGLNPEHYKLKRAPGPSCQAEFKSYGSEAVPLMLERLRWTLDAYPYSEGTDGTTEKAALVCGILYAAGHTADTRARFALLQALRNTDFKEHWRQVAAVSYGQTGGEAALVELCALLDDARQPLALREACGWAIGRVAEPASVEAIKTRLNDEKITGGENGVALVRALVTGAGILGNAMGWQARGTANREKANEVRRDCALLMLETLKKHPAEHEVIANALVQIEWRDSLGWLEDLTTDSETAQAIKDAALKCIGPLKDTLSRK